MEKVARVFPNPFYFHPVEKFGIRRLALIHLWSGK